MIKAREWAEKGKEKGEGGREGGREGGTGQTPLFLMRQPEEVFHISLV